MQFNAAQSEAIQYNSNLLVLAPPGSGKTGLIIGKARHIVETNPNTKIALVTFTNAATEELEHRLRSLLPSDVVKKRISVRTFHGHCMDLLRQANRLGKILGPNESVQVLRQAMSDSDFAGKYEDALIELEQAKRNLAFNGQETPLVQAYESIRRRHRASDLNDVVREAVLGLKRGDIKPLPVTHLLGDEYQDSDQLQIEFTVAHSDAGVVTSIVGDDDQSIYSFRGSEGFRGMLDYRERTHAHQVILEINYRSRAEILDAAAAVIRNNVDRVDKVVLSHRKSGGRVSVMRLPNRQREAHVVCNILRDDHETPDADVITHPKGRWAIIGRTNSDFRLIEGTLRMEGITYHKNGGRDEVPDDAQVFMAFLRSLQTGESLGLEMALRRCPVDPTAVNGLMQALGADHHTFLDGDVPELDRPLPEDRKVLESLASMCSRWRDLLSQGQYERVIDGVAAWFLDNGLVQSKNADEDFVYWASLLKRGRGSLTRRTEMLLSPRDRKATDGVTLTTMHASKGLEFERVIIIQANTGAIPSPKNPSVEEERRLFFVAITRAKDDLTVMTHTDPGPSPFIAELLRSPAAKVVSPAR